MKTRPNKPHALADLIGKAWEDNAVDAKFAGMTLAQFRARTAPSVATRETVTSLQSQLRAKRDERATADFVSREVNQRVVAAVKADPDHGPDSPLLAAMAY